MTVAPQKAQAPGRLDSEVVVKPVRRRFSAEYKLKIVRQADACKEQGAVGALLRREGLYSSHLVTWRRAVNEGSLGALAARRRGPKPAAVHPLAKRVAELERDNERLQKRLGEAEIIIAVQKKLADLLAPQPPAPKNSGSR
jgi:transposase-like protein